MFTALLFPLAVLASPGHAPALAPAGSDDPAIRITLNNDGRYQRGDRAKVYVQTRNDGYIVVLHVDPDHRLRVLFPLDPRDDNFVRGGHRYEIVGRADREPFNADYTGSGTVYAAVSRDPFQFTDYIVGDHWDFRALNDVRVGSDVEADLNDLTRHLATRDFDYDVVRYETSDRVAYLAPTVYAPVYTNAYYDPWCFGYWGCGSGLSIGISIGHPRYWYDPFYTPYVYPAFYYPYPRYYYPFYHHPHYPRAFYRPPRPGGHFYGGHYTGTSGGAYGPWRNRLGPQPVTTTWPGQNYAGRLAAGAGQVNGYRDRRFTPQGGGVAAVTRPRRSVESRRPDMTPVRSEPTRARMQPGTPAAPTPVRHPNEEPRPVGRRSVEVARPTLEPARAESRRSEQARLQAPREVSPSAEPRRLPEAHAANPQASAPREATEMRERGNAERSYQAAPSRSNDAPQAAPRRSEARPAPQVERTRREAPPARERDGGGRHESSRRR